MSVETSILSYQEVQLSVEFALIRHVPLHKSHASLNARSEVVRLQSIFTSSAASICGHPTFQLLTGGSNYTNLQAVFSDSMIESKQGQQKRLLIIAGEAHVYGI